MAEQTTHKPIEGRIYKEIVIRANGEKRLYRHYICKPGDFGYSSDYIAMVGYILPKIKQDGLFGVLAGWSLRLLQLPLNSVSADREHIHLRMNPTTNPYVKQMIIDEKSPATERVAGRNLIQVIKKAERETKGQQ